MSASSRVDESIKGADMTRFPLDQRPKDVTDAYRNIYTDNRIELHATNNARGLKLTGVANFCPEEGCSQPRGRQRRTA